MARGKPGLLTRLLVPSQPSRYRWHAESSPGTDVSQSPSFSPCLFWEVHPTASLYHNRCSSCSSVLLCIQQKCSEACNPASLPPTAVSFLLVPKACWARGWGIWGQPLFFIYKVANLITNFPCQSPWLQDWLPATFVGRNGCQNHFFL